MPFPPLPPLPPTQAIATNGSENAPMQTVRLMDPVSVAVLDTGVDCFHPDLNVIFNKSFVQKDSVEWVVSDANGCADVFNHGTNVAGAHVRSGALLVTSGPCLPWAPALFCSATGTVFVVQSCIDAAACTPLPSFASWHLSAVDTCVCVACVSCWCPAGIVGAKNNGFGVVGVAPSECGCWPVIFLGTHLLCTAQQMAAPFATPLLCKALQQTCVRVSCCSKTINRCPPACLPACLPAFSPTACLLSTACNTRCWHREPQDSQLQGQGHQRCHQRSRFMAYVNH
jgi:hypothetical protein